MTKAVLLYHLSSVPYFRRDCAIAHEMWGMCEKKVK